MQHDELNARDSAVPEPAASAGAPGPAGSRIIRRRIAAPFAIPAGCTALLVTGALAAATHGAVSGGWVLLLAAVVTGAAGLIAEPGATLFLVAAAWLSVAGFSRPPYAQLQVTWQTGALAALVLSGTGLAAMAAGAVLRKIAASYTLEGVKVSPPGVQIGRAHV